MMRAIVGFVAGAVVWQPAFFVLAGVTGNLLWPEYGTHGQVWFEQGTYTFTAPMSVLHVVCWAASQVLAGWLSVAIGRRREVAWALAAVLAAYLCVLHLYLYWPNFPWWYNVAVASAAAPAVLLGGRLARRFVQPHVPAAAAR